MKTRFLFVLLVGAVAYTGSAQSAIKANMDTWLGAPESNVLKQHGAPAREVADGEGGKILVYEFVGAGEILPGAKFTSFNGVAFQAASVIVPPEKVSTEYFVNKYGRVYGWRTGGQSNFSDRNAGALNNDQLAQLEKWENSKPAENKANTEMVNALNDWENSIRKQDTAFGAITPPDDSKHGVSVADRVFDALRLKCSDNPKITAAQLVTEAQRVYDIARQPKPQSGVPETQTNTLAEAPAK